MRRLEKVWSDGDGGKFEDGDDGKALMGWRGWKDSGGMRKLEGEGGKALVGWRRRRDPGGMKVEKLKRMDRSKWDERIGKIQVG